MTRATNTSFAGDGSSGDGSDAAARRQLERIGAIIRNARHGIFTLEELAHRAGLSSGLLSQLERGHGNPSIATLSKLAYALGLPIGSFFEDPHPEAEDILVRKHQRRRLALPHEGLAYELLTPDLRRSIAVLRTEIPPGFRNEESPFHHVGEECIYVVSGRLTVVVGDSRFELGEGDAITYDSGIPHWFAADVAVEILGAITPPHF